MYLSICFFIVLSWLFGGAERGKMKLLLVRYITLPGRKNQLDLPAARIAFQDSSRLPNCRRDIRNKETPCQQRQMGMGRRIAFCLGVLSGSPSPGMNDFLWD